MSSFDLLVWLLRLSFLGLLYLFLALLARGLLRDLRRATSRAAQAPGAVVVMATAGARPALGARIKLDTISTIGRDADNTVVVDDPFASARHAQLTYRGRVWYVEDLGSTNGTMLNGRPVVAAQPLGYGDEVAIGQTRVRLERTAGS
ncbi:MAG: FHA domain-containing protein [Candidatus Limnocylindrales bacterium]